MNRNGIGGSSVAAGSILIVVLLLSGCAGQTTAPQSKSEATALQTQIARLQADSRDASATAQGLRNALADSVLGPGRQVPSLKAEPSGDVTARQLKNGIQFDARIIAVDTTSQALTFDVATERIPKDSPSEAPIDVNHFKHLQTLSLHSAFIPVVLTITDWTYLAPGQGGSKLRGDAGQPPVVAFDEFAQLWRSNAEFTDQASGDFQSLYTIYADGDGIYMMEKHYHP